MRILPVLLATLVPVTAAYASDDHSHETRELGSHEHGAAEMQIAIEGSTVEIALELPGQNVVGFEHKAETDEQRAAVDEQTKVLEDVMTVLTVPEAAGCEVSSSEVEVHIEGDHSAFEAEYALNCTDVSAIDTIATSLFETYPSLEEIDVEYATPNGQGASELEPGAATVTLATS